MACLIVRALDAVALRAVQNEFIAHRVNDPPPCTAVALALPWRESRRLCHCVSFSLVMGLPAVARGAASEIAAKQTPEAQDAPAGGGY